MYLFEFLCDGSKLTCARKMMIADLVRVAAGTGSHTYVAARAG